MAPSNKKQPQHSDGIARHAVKYEFMGPPGAAVIMLTLPLVVYGLYFGCNRTACPALNPSSADFLSVK